MTSRQEKIAELLFSARFEKAGFDHTYTPKDDPLPQTEKEVMAFIRRRTQLYMETWVITPILQLLAEDEKRPCVALGCGHSCSYRDGDAVYCLRPAVAKDPSGLCEEHRSSRGAEDEDEEFLQSTAAQPAAQDRPADLLPDDWRAKQPAAQPPVPGPVALGFHHFLADSTFPKAACGLVINELYSYGLDWKQVTCPGCLDKHQSAVVADVQATRLAFLAHAFYCSNCVHLAAPAERNAAFRNELRRDPLGGFAACPAGAALARAAEDADTREREARGWA